MSRKLVSIIVCLSLLFTTLACQLFSGPNLPEAPSSTPAPAKADTATPKAVVPPTATEDTAATAEAERKIQQATEEAAQVQAATEAAAAEATKEMAQSLARTATVEGMATAAANDMYQLIEQLQSEEVLTNTSGQYLPIEDFEENWAQLGWYMWWNTGYQPADFVIRAHTSWESASKTPNLWDTGCGFVFRAVDENNHYMIFLAMDGNVYMRGYVDSKYRTFGKGYYGKVNHIKGEADVVLVAQGNRFVYYVNGTKVFDRSNAELAQGDLALTLMSGTNKDFGTRCQITDIELWALDQ